MSAPSVAIWRREELWKVRDPSLREKAAMCEDFEYTFCEGSHIAPIHIMEDHDQIGHRVWDGATLISKFLEHVLRNTSAASASPDGVRDEISELLQKLQFKGSTIVEVGAGTAIVSMVVAKLVACSGSELPAIFATDIPQVLPKMAAHIERNKIADIVEVQPLTWGDRAHEEALVDRIVVRTGLKRIDFIIASDLAAPMSVAADLAATIQRLAASSERKPILVMVSQMHREFTPAFYEAASRIPGLRLIDIDTAHWPSEYVTDRHRITIGSFED